MMKIIGQEKIGLRRIDEKIKLTRAQGGCPGTIRRRRTRSAAKSCGEPQAGIDPQISEWGNPEAHPKVDRTQQCVCQRQAGKTAERTARFEMFCVFSSVSFSGFVRTKRVRQCEASKQHAANVG